MLTYANGINILGEDGIPAVVAAVAKYLSEETGTKHGAGAVLKNKGTTYTHKKQRIHLKISSSTLNEEKKYSWRISRRDCREPFRRWVTELGLIGDSVSSGFTCAVYCEDIIPGIKAGFDITVPRIIRLISNEVSRKRFKCHFDPMMPGPHGKLQRYEDNPIQEMAMRLQLSNHLTSPCLVLLSKDEEGRQPIHPKKLEQTLMGLAQVALVDEESFFFPNPIGSENECADEGITGIFAVRPNSDVTGTYIRPAHFEKAVGSNQNGRCLEVLRMVLRLSNPFMEKVLIRPADVAIDAYKADLVARHKEIKALGKVDVEEELAMAYDEIDGLNDKNKKIAEKHAAKELEAMELEEQHNKTEDALKQAQYQIKQLESRSNESSITVQGRLSPLAMRLIQERRDPNTKECLELAATAHSNIVILKSATESAECSSDFAGTRLLLELLNKLPEFLNAFQEGGDDQARRVYTNNQYSANENVSVTGRPRLRKMREFIYNGETLLMERHLKIGRADNTQKTIRVHFHLDTENDLVVIGYCGPHLPLS